MYLAQELCNVYPHPCPVRIVLLYIIRILKFRKWYVGITLKCKVSYLRRQLSHLLRHLLILWLTTQGVNIISAAYAQSFQSNYQSILQSFEIKLSY